MWPKIHNRTTIISLPLSWPQEEQGSPQFDQLLGQFTSHFQQIQWLSSCFPFFADNRQTRDIIAGGFHYWLSMKNNQCQLHYKAADSQQDRYPSLKNFPISWMLAQLEHITPTQVRNTSQALHKTWARPGWYGGLSYSFNSKEVGIDLPLKNTPDWPDALFGFARWVVTLDHDTQSATLLTILEKDTPELQYIINTWQDCVEKNNIDRLCDHTTPHLHIDKWQAITSKEKYLSAFESIQSAIDAGNTYQVNFSQCFETQFQGDPLAGFLHLKKLSPSPYAAFWSTPYGQVSSHSPELFIQTSPSPTEKIGFMTATTKPIKGTCPRGKTADEDALFAQQLQASAKNQAENTMIVDLLRNDLSKTAVPGSMKVPQLCALESFASIHHLVSEITCNIQPRYSGMDVIIKCFPGGSITGAPKRTAMQVIDTLEDMPRDIYCGSIGFWDHPYQALFNIAIRTLLFNQTNHTVKVWAGGGIVKDSKAESEYEECFHKVKHLMEALSTLEKK